MTKTALSFPNRAEAGNALAGLLQAFADKPDTYILALVRGGVAVGRSLADELNLPLFPYIVRKIGHPSHREFAVGAIAQGGSTYLDENVMNAYGLGWEDLEPVIDEEMKEMKRRKSLYTLIPLPDWKDKTVILTDDGSATGATMIAAIGDMQKAHAGKIVIALPVCPPDTKGLLQRKADEVQVLATPEPFNAVGQWYAEFPQLEDAEVISLLQG